jgi:hypothetical protein
MELGGNADAEAEKTLSAGNIVLDGDPPDIIPIDGGGNVLADPGVLSGGVGIGIVATLLDVAASSSGMFPIDANAAGGKVRGGTAPPIDGGTSKIVLVGGTIGGGQACPIDGKIFGDKLLSVGETFPMDGGMSLMDPARGIVPAVGGENCPMDGGMSIMVPAGGKFPIVGDEIFPMDGGTFMEPNGECTSGAISCTCG